MLMTTILSANAQVATPPGGIGDIATYDQMLRPLWNVYAFIKYTATAIAVLAIVIQGIKFMTSGNELVKREEAKKALTFIAVGLGVIWVAPLAVRLITA